MEDWLLMQSFYHGLIQKAHELLDATVGGSFMSLTLGKAETVIVTPQNLNFWKRSHASGIVSPFYCWKFEIFPLKALVLPTGKNFSRKAFEHLAHVLM